MTKYLIGAVLLVVLGYGLIEAHPLLAGPSLSIASPKNGARLSGGVVTIQGTVARTASLTLDGAALLPEANGSFSTTLAFAPGVSILTLVATDRFGRSVTEHRTVFVPN